MNESQEHAKQKKPEINVPISMIPLYKVEEERNLIACDKNQNSGCPQRYWLGEGLWELAGMIEMLYTMIWVMDI